MSARVSSPSSRSSGVGERGLRGPAAAEHDHFVDRAAPSAPIAWSAVSVGRDLFGVEHEHAGDVDGDVAVADDDGARGGEVELVVGVVRVAVVPGDELRGRVRAGAVLARDAEAVVGRGADRVDDGVVALQQVLAGDVRAELDAAEEAEARVLGGLLVDARDALDLRVVRRDAGAYEAERRRAGPRAGPPRIRPSGAGRWRRSQTGRRRRRQRAAQSHS